MGFKKTGQQQPKQEAKVQGKSNQPAENKNVRRDSKKDDGKKEARK